MLPSAETLKFCDDTASVLAPKFHVDVAFAEKFNAPADDTSSVPEPVVCRFKFCPAVWIVNAPSDFETVSAAPKKPKSPVWENWA